RLAAPRGRNRRLDLGADVCCLAADERRDRHHDGQGLFRARCRGDLPDIHRPRPAPAENTGSIGSMTIFLLFGALLALVGFGFPVLLAIGLTSAAGIFLMPGVSFALFAQRTFAMLDSSSLLALPYFILAGALMSKGGLSRALVTFAQTLVGH